MFVAKSYENLTKLSEPFEKNGKIYITVKMKSGLPKDVRAYTAKEYKKMYPDAVIENEKISRAKPWDKFYKSQKEVLGFGELGFIWIFSGAIEENEDWFRLSPCRDCSWWNWYLPSDISLPPLPSGIIAHKLYAGKMFDEEDWLIDDKELIKRQVKECLKNDTIN